jgi:hypothetical protein
MPDQSETDHIKRSNLIEEEKLKLFSLYWQDQFVLFVREGKRHGIEFRH